MHNFSPPFLGSLSGVWFRCDQHDGFLRNDSPPKIKWRKKNPPKLRRQEAQAKRKERKIVRKIVLAFSSSFKFFRCLRHDHSRSTDWKLFVAFFFRRTSKTPQTPHRQTTATARWRWDSEGFSGPWQAKLLRMRIVSRVGIRTTCFPSAKALFVFVGFISFRMIQTCTPQMLYYTSCAVTIAKEKNRWKVFGIRLSPSSAGRNYGWVVAGPRMTNALNGVAFELELG